MRGARTPAHTTARRRLRETGGGGVGSGRRLQSGKRDRHEAAGRGSGRQTSGGGQRMDTEVREFGGRHVVADRSRCDGLYEQVRQQLANLVTRPGNLRVAVHQRHEIGVVVRRVSLPRSCSAHGRS